MNPFKRRESILTIHAPAIERAISHVGAAIMSKLDETLAALSAMKGRA